VYLSAVFVAFLISQDPDPDESRTTEAYKI